MTKASTRRAELEALHGQAIAWIICLTSGEATIANTEDFELWRRQSPAHAAAFAEAAKLWHIARAAGRFCLGTFESSIGQSSRGLKVGSFDARHNSD
jgi:ferric-dicitrate binding protein FerR (iron transport regulator)